MTPPPTSPTRRVAIVIEMEHALPWHQDCYEGIRKYGDQHGWRCSLDEYAAGIHGDLSRSDYDGVVGRIPLNVAKRVAGFGLPMVNLTRYVDPDDADRFSSLPGVYIDRQAGTRMAVEHLAQTGYPRVGVIAVAGFEHEQLLADARAACTTHGRTWVEPFVWHTALEGTFEAHAALMRSVLGYLSSLEKPVGLMVSHAPQGPADRPCLL